MDKRQIDHFFKTLDVEFQQGARAILTGAAAGTIMGSTRPSMDIDFAIEFDNLSEDKWKQLESAIRKAVEITGIQANYAEDIDRWGMITLLDYRKHTKLYKKYGKLALRVLDPAYWSIGKMTRFIDPDIQDMIQVFRKKKTPPLHLAKIWGKALRESPKSIVLARFRRQVESFFESYGTKIWGSSFNSKKTIHVFHRSAGIGK
jgi:DNA primase catalytic subunit